MAFQRSSVSTFINISYRVRRQTDRHTDRRTARKPHAVYAKCINLDELLVFGAKCKKNQILVKEMQAAY